jgi:hypothetical protein
MEQKFHLPCPLAVGSLPRFDTLRGVSKDAQMLTALILVCSLETTPDLETCTRENAVKTMRAPESFANPATCFMHSQAYLADTSFGRDLAANERVKVVCVRAASMPFPPPGSAQTDSAQAR